MTPSAYAACTSPAGQAGDIAWASNYSVPVYCDGTNWNSMAGGSGSGGADNLGNHTATQALNMGGFDISNLGTATGTAAVLGGLTVTGNASITTVSATNISGSLIQVGTGNSATCNSATKGAIRYSNTSSTIEYCNSTAWTSVGPSTSVPAFSVYPSDRRLKQDITPIDASLEKLLQVNGVTFRYSKEGDQGAQHMGVIAQEVEKVFPEAVLTGADGMKSVNYPALVAPLIEAVKELKAANDNQALEIEELRKAIGGRAP